MKLLSMIVVLYNEEQMIDSYYQQMTKLLNDINYECIFIDDGSHDHTLHKLHVICEQDFHCHYISLRHNLSISEAYYIGVRYAQGDYILTSDVLHPLYMIPQMYRAMEQYHVPCIGGRLIHRNDYTSTRKQRYFKIFECDELKNDDIDYDEFKKRIRYIGENMKWISYHNLEETQITRIQKLYYDLNQRYEQRLIFLLVIAMFTTIIMIPSVLILYYDLDTHYSIYISSVMTICVLLVIGILHSRLCNFQAKRHYEKIRETTFN